MTELGFRCDGVSHSFRTGAADITALDGVSFEAEPGEFICLVGPSGCGKSTLLRILAGLLEPTGGRVLFGGSSTERPKSALVFQESGVFPWMTVRDNVAFGLEMQGAPRREREQRADDLLKDVGLEGFADRWPHELSVGMRQRVNVARAFIADVQLLLMDEPFGALDALTKRIMQEELIRLWRRQRHTLVFVTHDVDEAVALADRIIVLTQRPAKVLEEFVLPRERPRGPSHRKLPEVRGIGRQIWNLVLGEEQSPAEIAVEARP
ncbi:MAG: ABC transporter ATP-binding protein [Gemmatimonadaceae bacterium]